MPQKKKSRLDPAKEVKRLARERIGTVPPARVEEEKRDKRQEKHKKTWEDWEKEDSLLYDYEEAQ